MQKIDAYLVFETQCIAVVPQSWGLKTESHLRPCLYGITLSQKV